MAKPTGGLTAWFGKGPKGDWVDIGAPKKKGKYQPCGRKSAKKSKRAYPKLQKLINFMKYLKHLEFVRMTGSGSTVIAYFKTKNASLNATKVIKKKYKKYWCILSKTI